MNVSFTSYFQMNFLQYKPANDTSIPGASPGYFKGSQVCFNNVSFYPLTYYQSTASVPQVDTTRTSVLLQDISGVLNSSGSLTDEMKRVLHTLYDGVVGT
jgi:hypothetical protein